MRAWFASGADAIVALDRNREETLHTTYATQNSAVLADGRNTLTQEEVWTFLRHAVRRKLRLRGAVEQFMTELVKTGHAEYTYYYARRAVPECQTIIEAEVEGDGFALRCLGPQAEYTLERVRHAFEYRSELNRARKQRVRPARRLRARRKKLRPASGSVPQLRRRMPHERRRRFAPAPISLKTKERVSGAELGVGLKNALQFRHNHIAWTEAIKATVAIFGMKSNGKRSAVAIVNDELLASCRRSGQTFARFSRRGFELRFDLIDGVWRGDITPLTITATKGPGLKLNKEARKLYQRMRAYFREQLGFLTDSERRERREAFEAARTVPEGAVVLTMGGLPYRTAC